jgi:hypothetical protein
MKKVVVSLIVFAVVALAPWAQADEMPAILAQVEGAQVMSDIELIDVEGTGLLDGLGMTIDPVVLLTGFLEFRGSSPDGDPRTFFRDFFINLGETSGPGGGLLIRVVREGGLTDETRSEARGLLLPLLAGLDPQIAALISLFQAGPAT